MSRNKHNTSAKTLWLLCPSAVLLAGCSRTPSIDILGSFFPAWLVCVATACLLTALTRVVLMRFQMKFDLPGLAYPSLAAVYTFGLWLIFFY